MATYRQATLEEARVLYDLFEVTVDDLSRRMGYQANSTADDPDPWAVRRPLWEHLGRTGEPAWLALDDDGRPIGYARSILRDRDRELTEFFVLPGHQSAGVGRELLDRAFPAGAGAAHRSVIATGDPRALGRYLKTGLEMRFPIVTFMGAPTPETVPTDLALEPVEPSRSILAALDRVDRRVIGHRRPEDHRWLMDERQAVVARRDRRIVGYAYGGRFQGPIAALDPADVPALLAWAESAAAIASTDVGATATGAAGREIGFDVPLTNVVAVRHLLARGYRIDPFITYYLSDGPAGRFDRYVVTSPPLFI
jgi:GNAT superfamily N-acetyltransferase